MGGRGVQGFRGAVRIVKGGVGGEGVESCWYRESRCCEYSGREDVWVWNGDRDTRRVLTGALTNTTHVIN